MSRKSSVGPYVGLPLYGVCGESVEFINVTKAIAKF